MKKFKKEMLDYDVNIKYNLVFSDGVFPSISAGIYYTCEELNIVNEYESVYIHYKMSKPYFRFYKKLDNYLNKDRDKFMKLIKSKIMKEVKKSIIVKRLGKNIELKSKVDGFCGEINVKLSDL